VNTTSVVYQREAVLGCATMPADDLKAPVQVAVYCDRCEAQLVVDGNTHEEANEKLRALVIEKRWQITNRIAGMLDAGETFGDPTPMRGTQDLCADCTVRS